MSRRAINIIAIIAGAACITEIILAEIYKHHTGMLLVAIVGVAFTLGATLIHEKENRR